MTQKPENIEAFCIAFCMARLHGDPLPETVEVVNPDMPKLASISRKLISQRRARATVADVVVERMTSPEL
jgi:hypothetical protein